MTHSEPIRVVIPGTPFAQPRPRAVSIGGHARVYPAASEKVWRGSAQVHMQRAMQGRGILSCPIDLLVWAFWACPRGQERKRKPRAACWRAKKPDLTNVVKAVEDAANGIVWKDDNQVVYLRCAKIQAPQGEAPRIEITIAPLDEDQVWPLTRS